MPKGPRGEKRPADVIGGAIKVAKIATGEEDDARDGSPLEQDDSKAASAAASKLGKKGGRARAESLSPERRREIAKKAAESRWGGTSDD
jgi:hypothetical protein